MKDERKATYTARIGRGERFTGDQLDFLSRRTMPFLKGGGTSRSIEHLLQEAYLQGLRDASEVMGGRCEQ